jgi:DNA polymerase-3 subunit gamma/tau
MPQALYSKWRPRRWDEVIGQDHIIQTLRNAVNSDHIVHAYLFAGPRGTGKTTTARLLAKAVNCLDADLSERPCDKCDHCLALSSGRFLDLIEIDAASNTSVDDVRDLREKINFSPNLGRYKVYVIDEVHMLSNAAFNALLKTLEEPPAHAILILATTEVHKIPATVLSRCQRHEFRRIPVADIIRTLEELAEKEHFEVSNEALDLIARHSTGSLRDAISLLDQLSSTGKDINLGLAQDVLGTATSQAVVDVVESLLACEPDAGLNHIHKALDSGSDVRQFTRQIVDFLRNILLVQIGEANPSNETPEMETTLKDHAKKINTPELINAIHLFNKAANDSRTSWQPGLPLEVAFIEACQTLEKSTPQDKQKSTSNLDRPKPTAQKGQQSTKENAVRETNTSTEKSLPRDDQQSNKLNQDWPQVLLLVRKEHPNLYGLLNSSQSRHLAGNELILGFASEILKNQMAKRENVEVVKIAVSQVLGSEVDVRCVITTAKNNDIPTEVDDDGMVASALRDMGGEIVDIQ